MPPRKQTSEAPSHFFKQQLTGEEPPSLATMQDLFQLARRFAEMQPWYTLSEGDLIMVPAEDNQICFCSVMGELGEVFALQVYTGLRGYSFFQRLSTGKIHSAGDFFAEHRGVSVEFVHSKELKPPDRELLRALGYSTRGGAPGADVPRQSARPSSLVHHGAGGEAAAEVPASGDGCARRDF